MKYVHYEISPLKNITSEITNIVQCSKLSLVKIYVAMILGMNNLETIPYTTHLRKTIL
jgi:hypothetical protein